MKPEILRWVKIVVLRTVREKRLTHLDVDTLISAGFEGYSQSLGRFDESRGVAFKTFAEYRIRGAVLDEVRKMIGDERCKNKRPTQVSDFDFTRLGDDNRISNVFESQLDVDKFFAMIPLDARDTKVLRCRIDGMNLKEIGSEFGFSESRASQVLATIKRQIYPWFREYLGTNFRLVTYRCPECHHDNEAAEFSSSFDCEKCEADVTVKDGVTSLKFGEGSA